MAVRNSLSR